MVTLYYNNDSYIFLKVYFTIGGKILTSSPGILNQSLVMKPRGVQISQINLKYIKVVNLCFTENVTALKETKY